MEAGVLVERERDRERKFFIVKHILRYPETYINIQHITEVCMMPWGPLW